MKPRENELTAIIGREKFELYPGNGGDANSIRRWVDFRVNYKQAQELRNFSFPLQLDFELNSTCNMRCSFCPHGNGKIPRAILPFELFTKAIDEAAQWGLCSIKLNYINEPLLDKRLVECIKYAKSKGIINVCFATNGSLLTRSTSEELIIAGLSKIMISLDATTNETYLAMRGNNKLPRIVSNILRFISIRNTMGLVHPLVQVNFLKTKINEHEAKNFVRFWTDKADIIGFQSLVYIPGVNASEPLPDKQFKCSFPFKLLTVDSNGDILPCCTFSGREMPLGNIATMSIKDAWDSQKISELKRIHLEGNYQQNPICDHCVNGK